MSRDIITDILNKVQALCEADIVTYAQVAKESKINTRTFESWFGTKRRYRPKGDAAMRLFEWTAAKTLAICQNRKAGKVYRSAYTRICGQFPVNGKD